LYVGAFDQKSVGQPLYEEAPVQEPDPNFGAGDYAELVHSDGEI